MQKSGVVSALHVNRLRSCHPKQSTHVGRHVLLLKHQEKDGKNYVERKGRFPHVFASILTSCVLAQFREMKKANKFDFWKMTVAPEHIWRRLTLREFSCKRCPVNVPELRVLCRVRSWPKAEIGHTGMWGVHIRGSNRPDMGNPPPVVHVPTPEHVVMRTSSLNGYYFFLFFLCRQIVFPHHFILGNSRTVLTETFPNNSAQRHTDIG